ncbi:hypothetical protein QEZ54_20015 [Catellatospora sp. KI3]|uniref:hypothetical protein n=1 Tax=Catellatospora sp. KI3 TaxID=3041620 RepID=UPI00248297DA|nr:hypothetical protein [Catellatospora sp. KI3]MDI1463272.1 hypothetical protein [Catellatospora sp. KI3]
MSEAGTWGLHHDGVLVARIIVTGGDFPWMHGRVEALPGFDAIRPLFTESEATGAAEDVEAHRRMLAATSLTYPEGDPVAEYWLKIFDDGTCGWRWHDDEPFDD